MTRRVYHFTTCASRYGPFFRDTASSEYNVYAVTDTELNDGSKVSLSASHPSAQLLPIADIPSTSHDRQNRQCETPSPQTCPDVACGLVLDPNVCGSVQSAKTKILPCHALHVRCWHLGDMTSELYLISTILWAKKSRL